ncbi:hypothetical protein TSAR_015615 [Trichomalopsis sarcophagae]|uniref:Uncharacterized protein n=1 Tax=Trichomalopsis sarcophagae TaxID=543379 RepID=A0A232ENY3_9HYME|nr:hypothetical protein TSAR_015615 [Trichomalopsis sarcophagae]
MGREEEPTASPCTTLLVKSRCVEVSWAGEQDWLSVVGEAVGWSLTVSVQAGDWSAKSTAARRQELCLLQSKKVKSVARSRLSAGQVLHVDVLHQQPYHAVVARQQRVAG